MQSTTNPGVINNASPKRQSHDELEVVPTLSKNQLKRQLKRQKLLDERPAKRAAERARKKAKKLDMKQTHPEISHQTLDQPPIDPSTRHKPTLFPSRVVFDCRFDDKMSEKEIISLDRQIAHSYAINRRANVQFEKLICTSFNGQLRKRFESNGNQHLRWKSVKFTPDSIEDLVINENRISTEEESENQNKTKEIKILTKEESFKNDDNDSLSSPSPSPSSSKNVDQSAKLDKHQKEREIQSNQNHNETPATSTNYDQHTTSDPTGKSPSHTQQDLDSQGSKIDSSIPKSVSGLSNQHSLADSNLKELKNFNRSDLIYLTADSKNVLTSIDPHKVYVIGSIVDHNRYKNLCLDLSCQLGISHAQLPINEYFSQLKTRKVLTVNQVFEILIQYLEFNDWKIAFQNVIPCRKL